MTHYFSDYCLAQLSIFYSFSCVSTENNSLPSRASRGCVRQCTLATLPPLKIKKQHPYKEYSQLPVGSMPQGIPAAVKARSRSVQSKNNIICDYKISLALSGMYLILFKLFFLMEIFVFFFCLPSQTPISVTLVCTPQNAVAYINVMLA